MLPRFVLPLFVVAGAIAVPACGDDASPIPSSAGSGGSGGDDAGAVTGGRGGRGGTGGRSTGDGGDASVAPEDGGPVAPRSLTLLHGVTDSPWVAFCIAKVQGGVEAEVAPAWIPGGGLEYGHSVAVSSLDGIELGTDAFRAYVIAARSESVVRGLDCSAAIARARAEATPPVVETDGAAPEGGIADASVPGAAEAGARDAAPDAPVDAAPPPPPPIADIRVAALPAVPAAALAESATYLLSVTGCIGGPGATHPAEQSICGFGYGPTNPSVTETLVRVSAATDDRHVGLQYLAATPAFGRSDLTILPARNSDGLSVAEDVGVGALRPAEPYFGATAFDLSASSASGRVRISATGAATPSYDMPWAPTLAAGDLTGLEDGKTYTLVFVGPSPGFTKSDWWNGSLVSIIRNRPEL